MRGAWLAVALLATGCDRLFELSPAPDDPLMVDAPDGDGPVDMPPDGPCVGTTVGSGNVVAPLCLSQGAIDTPVPDPILTGQRGLAGSGNCDFVVGQDDDELCVIAATDFAIASGVTVIPQGERPLVLAVTNAITIIGTLDVSSTDLRIGAGADWPGCSATMPAQPVVGAGAGGGGFGSAGGAGGKSTVVTMAPPGGVATAPQTLRGGCPGTQGGDRLGVDPEAIGGAGGHSGGAVYLVAGGTISVQGQIFANGEGGRGGGFGGVLKGKRRMAGGGGGGSGGMILVDAVSLVIAEDASVIALGGGGGGGGGTRNAGSTVDVGKAGSGATYQEPLLHWAGAGGAGGLSTGGQGGTGGHIRDGGSLDGLPGEDADDETGGGGGGGGGAGVIITQPAAGSGRFEPPRL